MGSNRTYGFTLVEMAVTIVVIGILAVITIVAYNGVQLRARNAAAAATVSAYIDAFSHYRVAKGQYPAAPSTAAVCLGRDYPNNKCWLDNVNVDTTFMTDLEKTSGTGALGTPKVGGALKGAIFTPSTNSTKLDGVDTNWITYVVEGKARCPVGNIATWQSGQLYSSAAPASGQSVPPNAFGEVQCWVPLPPIS